MFAQILCEDAVGEISFFQWLEKTEPIQTIKSH